MKESPVTEGKHTPGPGKPTPADDQRAVRDILTEWKARFATHKSMTLSRAFKSLPVERGLLEARTALLSELDGYTIEQVEADRLYSRKTVFSAFDSAINAADAEGAS